MMVTTLLGLISFFIVRLLNFIELSVVSFTGSVATYVGSI